MNALLAEELARRHEVTVLTSRGPGLPPESTESGVRVVRVSVLFRRRQATASIASMLAYLPMGVRAGTRLVRQHRFDVINTHFVLPSGPVGDALSRAGAIPNVLSVHGGDLYDPSKWTSPHRHALLRAWVRRLLRRADVVVGQSTNTLDNARRFYAPEIDGVRIPLGIKRPVGQGIGHRPDFGCRADEVLLVTLGRLVPRKAVSQLLTHVRELANPAVRLLILGSGPEETSLRRQCAAEGLDRQVRFLGAVAETRKFEILRMCDVFVSTSQHEGFGLVFLEAMASRLPVVCYDHGGQTDFLEDGITGFVVPLNDPDRFRARCERLIADRELRLRMGEENWRRVQELFIERCAASYERLFEGARRR